MRSKYFSANTIPLSNYQCINHYEYNYNIKYHSLKKNDVVLIISNFNGNNYYVNDYINFDLIWNIGIGFGFLSTESSLFYNLVTLIIGIVILFLVYVFGTSKIMVAGGPSDVPKIHKLLIDIWHFVNSLFKWVATMLSHSPKSSTWFLTKRPRAATSS